MQVPKASDVLADALRERILSGEFVEGTPLPPERELVVQTRMSRTTVRESLRILEVQGLVRIKAGRAGGAFVQRPGEESMARSVGLLIRGRQIRLAALLETREAIEPFCARLAATHRTDEDLDALGRANADLEASLDEPDLALFLQSNLDWHVAVAAAGHNELLTGMMMALSRAIYTATENEAFVDRAVKATTLRAHTTITNAIRDLDPDAAVRRMTRHVHSYAEALMQVDERTDISVPDED
ncbi:FCD domain-containing protein [Nakamurella sp. YIM 132087]|uniref:FCD domain-containing protein n=2 Tax=Nakamurella alba TaxID=2665158 RepID=A0A7K1FEF3_9ACTN|nr:FCD domain-containing protein [Nakamurella alba]